MEATLTLDPSRPDAPPSYADVEPSWGEFAELLLSDDEELDELLLTPDALPAAMARMLAVSIAGLSLFGLAVGWVAQSVGVLEGSPAFWMPLALPAAFLSAIAISLPSFYFYTQLSGLDASFRLVTAQALRIQARTSTLLLGLLPFYVAVALASTLDVGWVQGLIAVDGWSAAETCVGIGLAAPFVVGLAGMWSTYRSFERLVDVVPITHERRGRVLLRMLVMWGLVATTITPVALYRLAEWMGSWG